MRTKLGLDLGTNSIGWWLYEIDDAGEIIDTVKAGVRIFSNGRDPETYTSLNEQRRAARSARRRRDRYLQRRNSLLHVLTKHGLMPDDLDKRKGLVPNDPYELRALAVAGDLDPFLVGRALFHINQRRGFKSNRIIDRARTNEDGPVHKSVETFKEKLAEQTVGQYLWKIRLEGRPVRARRGGTTQKDLYEYYPDRSMLEHEFCRIWDVQKQNQHGDLYTDAAFEEIKKLIFSQRPLKEPIVGKCIFYPDQDRINKSSPLFQRFRIFQELNNIRYYNDAGEATELQGTARKDVLKKMLSSRSVKFDSMKIVLVKQNLAAEPRINLEGGRRKALDGDLTRHALTRKGNIDAKVYDSWDLVKQEKLVSMLEDHEIHDDKMVEALCADWGLSSEAASNIILANLPSGHGGLCEKAIVKLMPYLENGKRYDEAVAEAELGSHSVRDEKQKDKHMVLPDYNQVLAKYCLPRRVEDTDNPNLWRIPNPTVHVALNQLRNVVNDLLRKFGRPETVVVEIGRDMPHGKRTREEISKRNNEHRIANEKRKEKLIELGLPINGQNLRLLRAWEELNEDCSNRRCIYTGDIISINKLFTAEVDIDHILPFAQTLDNSMANKIVCHTRANRIKGNKTPHEAFFNNPEFDWNEIWRRASYLPANKAWRFEKNALEQWREKHDFLDRQIPEMQYLSRAALEYLKPITNSGQVIPVPGSFTAMIRKHWGLNSILGFTSFKNREDHRHHAVDAAVIGAVSRSMINQLMAFATKTENDSVYEKLFSGKVPTPYSDYAEFRAKKKFHLNRIVVSHKTERHSGGQLHNKTAMGIAGKVGDDGRLTATYRVSISKIKTEKLINEILSTRLRNEIRNLYDRDQDSFRKNLEEFAQMHNIRRIKIGKKFKASSLAYIKDKNAKVYKSYKLDGNYCYEIYEKQDGRWDGEVISTYCANQREFIPNWRNEVVGAKFIMRFFRKGTFIEKRRNGVKRFLIVQKFTQGQIFFHEHFEANVDQRSRSKEYKLISKSPETLRKSGWKKTNVSSAGFVEKLRKNDCANS